MKLQCKVLITLCLVLSFYKLNAQIITTIAGGGTFLGDGGLATLAQVTLPSISAFDSSGNFYFFQAAGGPRIRKISPDGIIRTVAGNGTAGYSGDGGLATLAQLGLPSIAVDKSGNIYIADAYNNRVRKVDVNTGFINTIAGNGTATSTGDGGLAISATLSPTDITIDTADNLYILDGARIRKINTTGIISTVAGNGTFGFSGDGGPATAAQITVAIGICFNKRGDLYFATNGGTRIRKIDMSTGIITTIAGTGVFSYTGDGIPATVAQFKTYQINFNSYGSLYITDNGNHRIRMIDTFGIIHTVAGNGTLGFSGDGGLATAAQIYQPEGVSIDPCDNIYISDKSNNRIRKVTFNPPTTPTITISGIATATVGATVTVNATVSGAGSSYTIRWYRNSSLFSTTTTPTTTFTKAAGTDTITARIVPTIVYCYDSTTAAPHLVLEASVAIGYVPERQVCSVYPNPAQQELAISSPYPIHTITISSPVGQQWLAYTGNGSTEVQLSVAHLPPGVYIVRVNNGYSTKMIKE